MVAVQQMFTGVNAFTLLALPFFFLAGNVMTEGGISERLVKLAMALVGHLRGGLAHVNVVVGMFLSGISGSSTADAAAIGSIFHRAMVRRGYDERFAVCLTACTATMGAVIPPSILMVIYGATAGVSIGALADRRHPAGRPDGPQPDGAVALLRAEVRLSAGASEVPRLPGHLGRYPHRGLAARRAGHHHRRHGRRRVHPDGVRVDRRGVLPVRDARSSSGACKLSQMPKLFAETTIQFSQVLFCLGGASIFGWLLAFYQVPEMVTAFIVGFTRDPIVIMVLIVIANVLLGTFMEPCRRS